MFFPLQQTLLWKLHLIRYDLIWMCKSELLNSQGWRNLQFSFHCNLSDDDEDNNKQNRSVKRNSFFLMIFFAPLHYFLTNTLPRLGPPGKNECGNIEPWKNRSGKTKSGSKLTEYIWYEIHCSKTCYYRCD